MSAGGVGRAGRVVGPRGVARPGVGRAIRGDRDAADRVGLFAVHLARRVAGGEDRQRRQRAVVDIRAAWMVTLGHARAAEYGGFGADRIVATRLGG